MSSGQSAADGSHEAGADSAYIPILNEVSLQTEVQLYVYFRLFVFMAGKFGALCLNG